MMGMELRTIRTLWIVPLLAVTSLAAFGVDLRLVDAVRNHDREAVRSLLQQRVDVNAAQADGATALFWAAHWGDLETAELLIQAGAQVNVANEYGVTPLFLACTNGNAPMTEKLLKAGANVNAALPTGDTPLMTAARTGNVETAKLLLDHGANPNASENKQEQTALMWAVAEKHPEIVRLLIGHKADVHAHSKGGFTPLLFAARGGDLDSARMLLAAGANVNEVTRAIQVMERYQGDAPSAPAEGGYAEARPAVRPAAPQESASINPRDGAALGTGGMTPLLMAALNGHEKLAILFLEQGADPNAADSNGVTALHYSMLQGMSYIGGVRLFLGVMSYMGRPNLTEFAKALLAHGADPNARLAKAPRMPNSITPRFSMAGATPFLLAAASADPGLMRLLLEHRADPLLPTRGNVTPLMVAAGLCRYQDFAPGEEPRALEAVQLAFARGADVNAVGEHDYTALHGAAYTGANSIVEFLVQKGANMEVEDEFEQTPLILAEGIIGAGVVEFQKKAFGPHPSTAKLLLNLGAKPVAVSAP
jgi:ankyrin repeat protein